LVSDKLKAINDMLALDDNAFKISSTAVLWGYKRKFDDRAVKYCEFIAPMCLGYIDTLPKGDSLKKVKLIKRFCGARISHVSIWSTLFTRLNNIMVE